MLDRKHVTGLALALAGLALAAVPARQDELPRTPPPGLERWSPPEGDDARAELGRRLFFDPLLSRDRSVSCASCHDPSHGFADRERFSRGIGGARTARNAPTLWNRAFGASFFWDGRAATLEEQVLVPIENATEMDLPLDEALGRLAADDGYRAAFAAASGGAADRTALAAALASFVRRQFRGDSPVDRFLAGDPRALSGDEQSGLWIFRTRGACWRCHAGANFSDEGFHSTGVGVVAGVAEPGRGAISGAAEDHGKFKTPTLRGLAFTAPYMHDGSLATLGDVVEFYRRGGEAHAERDPLMASIQLGADDVPKLVAFLEALSRAAPPTAAAETEPAAGTETEAR